MAIIDIIGTAAGAAVIVKLIDIVYNFAMMHYKRKHAKEDKNEQKTDALNEFKTDINTRFDGLENSINAQGAALETTKDLVDALCQNEVSRSYVEIRRRALTAIKAGEIKDSTRRALIEDYDRYTKLPNSNDYLQSTIDAVKKLRLIIDDDELAMV